MPRVESGRVLVTGATGYIGSRLLPRLAASGRDVRAMGRSLAKLRAFSWAADAPRVELVQGDVLDVASLDAAMAGRDIVYYLVHSMTSDAAHFEDTDRRAARNVADAAARAGVRRIIYLGGMGSALDAPLSDHLRSRHEVGRVLASGSVPVTEFRAGVILGGGSASFEILRYLTDRLPIMITPRWVSTPSQPIAVRDVLAYLVDCLDAPETIGGVFEIGGPEVLSYRRLMRIYADEAGLRKRWIVPVPVLTPQLSSYWIHLVTPAPAALARPLAEGLRSPMIVKDDRILRILPRDLLSAREAVRLALDVSQHETTESHWTDAAGRAPAAWSYASDAKWTGGTILHDRRSVVVARPPAEVWARVATAGKAHVHPDAGRDGDRHARSYPATLRAGGAAADAWRVSDIEPGKHLRLVAGTSVPGRAMLEYTVDPEPGGSRITQTASFLPRGLAGLAYWYCLLPFHAMKFREMLRGLENAAAAGRSA